MKVDFKNVLVLEQSPPSFVRTVGQLLDWEIVDLILKKLNINTT